MFFSDFQLSSSNLQLQPSASDCFKQRGINFISVYFKGIARTQSPTIKNYALELPTFGVIVGVNQTVVQWKGLTLEEPPSWSWLTSAPGKYAFSSHALLVGYCEFQYLVCFLWFVAVAMQSSEIICSGSLTQCQNANTHWLGEIKLLCINELATGLMYPQCFHLVGNIDVIFSIWCAVQWLDDRLTGRVCDCWFAWNGNGWWYYEF